MKNELNKLIKLADLYASERYADGYMNMGITSDTSKARAALRDELKKLVDKLEAAEADIERMKHLVANVRCSGANIDGQHTWNFVFGKGWTTGASFCEAVDNAKKGQPK